MKSLKIILITLVVGLALVFAGQALATQSHENGQVTICHATGSQNNPYVENHPDKSGNVSGHNNHNGDIIPPFDYWVHLGQNWFLLHYNGKNWNTQGQAIWNNDCEIPVVVTPTPTPTPGNECKEDCNEEDPTPTPTPTIVPVVFTGVSDGRSDGKGEYHAPVCNGIFPDKPLLQGAKRVNATTVNFSWWGSANADHYSLVYGYYGEPLTMGVVNIDRNVTSFDINLLKPNKAVNAQLWAWLGQCVTVSETLDP